MSFQIIVVLISVVLNYESFNNFIGYSFFSKYILSEYTLKIFILNISTEELTIFIFM